jgi:hypothetical protein
MKQQILAAMLVAVGVLFVLSGNPSAAQGPRPSPTSGPVQSLLLGNDIMPPPAVSGQQGETPADPTDYKVTPIVFIPNDLVPNPLALRFVDKQMQLIQRWYREQLRDRTFTLEPAQLVIGSHPLVYYFGDCYPPTSTSQCSWGYTLWDRVFTDLSSLGYSWQSNRVHGIFFWPDGVAGVALGGGNQFLVSMDPTFFPEDCMYPGCGMNVTVGGAAHELGHAFGLPHTADDPEGSPGLSIMNYGFYGYPRPTFVNTSTNPERYTLYASPFINVVSDLKDGGFEDCLAFWNIDAGTPSCTNPSRRSGLSALTFASGSSEYLVRQDVEAVAGQTYDFSSWVSIASSGANLQFRIVVLDSEGSVLTTSIAGNYTLATNSWERAGTSLIMPTGTTTASIQIAATGPSLAAYVDDVEFRVSQLVPPIPLPMIYTDGDAVPTLQPTLQWSDTALATSYRVQVAADRAFNSIVADAMVSSPFYTIPSGLTYDTLYYWRVKALNGTGQSDWSNIWSLVPRIGPNYYSDEFEINTLNSAWSWVRGDSNNWRFSGPAGRRDFGYLGIRTQAGDLGGHNNAENLLLRYPPPGDYEISTKVDFWGSNSLNYQQGGLLIYQDDDNYLKLASIYRNGYKLELQAEINGAIVQQAAIPSALSTPLKIIRVGNSYSGYYSVDGMTWRGLGHSVTVDWANPRVGLMAFSELDVQQIGAYFDWFRVKISGQLHNVFLPVVTSDTMSSTATLVTNGGFENGFFWPDGEPTAWARDAWILSSASLSWDLTQSRSGTKSVKIQLDTSNDARWVQTVAVQPNTDYQLSGWIKTSNVVHSGEVVTAGANLGLLGTWDHTPGLFGANDWTYVNMPFNSGSNTQVTVACRLGYWSGTATGTMWCDDITLQPQ